MKVQRTDISTATTPEMIDIQPPELEARIFDMSEYSENLKRDGDVRV